MQAFPLPFPGPEALGRPSLDLNFLNSTVLDSRIAFSRASSGTYFDASGVLQAAAANAPRSGYDPVTHVALGLLIEEQRTNIILQSGNLATTGWVTGNLVVSAPVVTANAAMAPNGAVAATRIDMPAVTGTGAASFVLQPLGSLSSAVYTGSVWLRGAAGGEVISVFIQLSGTSYGRITVSLTTTWTRVSFLTSALPTNVNFCLGTDLRDSGQSPTAAETIYAWGAQIELGAFATSYIPTTTAAATRAADIASVPVGPWFNPSPGTLQVEYILAALTQPGVGYPPIIALTGANPNTDCLGLLADSGNVPGVPSVVARAAGTIISAPGVLGTISAGQVDKAVFTYGPSGMSFSRAGALPASDSLHGSLPTIASLTLGASGVSFQTNGAKYLRRIRYWPSALPNQKLQSVTR